MERQMVRTGLETFIENTDGYRGRRAGLIANHTSVTGGLEYGWDALKRSGVDLVRVFSPEHGLYGTEQDQVPVDGQPDFGFDLVSLYGWSQETLTPDRGILEGLDAVIFDIQDIGSRYYTYLNTMCYFMKAVSGSGIEFIVLDRPNPIGGLGVEGPLLREDYRSFVGLLPVAVRHGLTAGETAVMAKDLLDLDLDLRVFPMEGWGRGMLFPDTGLPWVPPSPNMPDFETALIYPGMCLIEGMNVSEGRGTTAPFKNIGAPFIRPSDMAGSLNSLGLDGVFFRPFYFKPSVNKYAGETCGGVWIHVTDRREFRPFLTGVAMAKTAVESCPEASFLHGVYEFNSKYSAFDLLCGGPSIREMIIGGADLSDISSSWEREESGYSDFKRRYHLYPGDR